jgi:hypothetical protein
MNSGFRLPMGSGGSEHPAMHCSESTFSVAKTSDGRNLVEGL